MWLYVLLDYQLSYGSSGETGDLSACMGIRRINYGEDQLYLYDDCFLLAVL